MDFRTSRDCWQVVGVVSAACLALQLASVSLLGRDLQTPNASTRIAESLVRDGTFGVKAWHRLRGLHGVIPDEPLRAFQLPGEPIFLAAGFRLLPEAGWRYLHVPVTVVFVAAIAAVGFLLGGRSLGLAAGLVAAFDPFVVVHGPVWDDTFLATAAEWAILAALVAALAARRASPEATRKWTVPLAIAGCAMLAAATRLQSQILLTGLALAVLASRTWRPARGHAWAIVLGVILAVGAWGARNAAVLHRFYLGTSHDGLTLFESTYRDAREAILQTGTAEGFSQSHLDEQFEHVAALGEVDADTQYRKEAWAYIAAQPLDVARTALLKLAVSFTGVDLGVALLSSRNLVTVGSNVAVLFVGLFGMWLCWREFRHSEVFKFLLIAFSLTAVLTLAMLALGPVGIRYRIGLTAFLYIGAGAVLIRALRWSRVDVDLACKVQS